jgi:hypothetical protein
MQARSNKPHTAVRRGTCTPTVRGRRCREKLKEEDEKGKGKEKRGKGKKMNM